MIARRDLAGRLGIFARTFRRDTAAEVASAISAAGYPLAHWNFAAIGRETLGGDVSDELVASVRADFDTAGLSIPSVSATYNVIHPNQEYRDKQTADAVRLIARVPELGADVVTLCTGTRDTESMWRAHPDNVAADAWTDLRRTLDVLLEAARGAGIKLGVEPEPGNVVQDAPTAARLLEELGEGAPIGIIFDAANLLTPRTIECQEQILGEAVDLLGPRIIGAQAKDVVESGHSAAGAGMMDYRLVLAQLERIAPIPLIVQDADESDAARVRDDLLRWGREADIERDAS